MKVCAACKTVLPLAAFAKHARRKDGLQENCRPCCAAYAADWRARNVEKIKADARAYAAANSARLVAKVKAWREANPERYAAQARIYNEVNAREKREYGQAWREANRETLVLKKTAYRHANRAHIQRKKAERYHSDPERYRKQTREWAAANPDKNRALKAQRRASKRQAVPSWADRAAIAEIYAETARLTRETGVLHHVDHTVPLRSRLVCGLHCEANLRPLPADENVKKNNRWWPDMPLDP